MGAAVVSRAIDSGEARWLLLIHLIPPKPNYLRVKAWRRLQRLGAVAIKNAAYVLPRSEQSQEDFHWVAQEITADGGEASVCEVRFVEGLSDAHVEALFNAARDLDYEQIAAEARSLAAGGRGAKSKRTADLQGQVDRLRKRLTEAEAIDFFGAPRREAAEGLVSALESRLRAAGAPGHRSDRRRRREELQGRTWVTRKGIHVDRMASAWLIRRFVDPEARFKFVPAKGYRPASGEIRFDMFEADFTHEGDCCTMEVLIARLGLEDPALAPIAEIVHDIDLKDGKFARAETVGIDHVIAGITMARRDDEERLERGAALFDDLYDYFRRKQR